MRTIEKEEYPRYVFYEDGRCWSDKHNKFMNYNTTRDDEYYPVKVNKKEVKVYVSQIKTWFKDKEQ